MTNDGNRSAPLAHEVNAHLADWYARTRQGAPRDAERTRRMLSELPFAPSFRVVHVVGTNGKGSVAARVDAGLRAGGLRTVRFTSPHVERFHERVTVQGVEVDNAVLLPAVQRVNALPSAQGAPFFDLATVLAVLIASSESADVLVLEAGVGAARDATLAVPNVVVSIVTNVEEDHLATIGPTVEDVARDKAEAVRPGVPCVTGATGVGLAVVRSTCEARGAPFVHVPPMDERHGSGVVEHAAALAVATLKAGFGIESEPAVSAAREDPHLPARRERFALPGNRWVVLDGAHNPPAAVRLARDVPEDAHALIAVASRKDVEGVLAAFTHLPVVTRTVAVAGDHVAGDVIEDPLAALARALAGLPEGGTLLVTGSFYLAGIVRPWLRAWAQGEREASWRQAIAGYAPRS